MIDELRLELELKEVAVVLVDKDGDEKKYTLRELTGKDRNKYLNKMADRMKIGKDGKTVGIKSFDGMQSDLLRVSMFDQNGDSVTVEDIEALPSSTQQKLFETAQKISGLDTGVDTEKND